MNDLLSSPVLGPAALQTELEVFTIGAEPQAGIIAARRAGDRPRVDAAGWRAACESSARRGGPGNN
jgi:hypothetical protein